MYFIFNPILELLNLYRTNAFSPRPSLLPEVNNHQQKNMVVTNFLNWNL